MKVRKQSIYNALSYLVDVFEGNYLAHAKNVAYTSVLIAKRMAFDEKRLERLYYLALLHDVGAGNTYGLKEHCQSGEELIRILGYDDESRQIIKYHHETINGEGPFSLKGAEIPLESLIIHIANQIDYILKQEKSANYQIKTNLIDYINSRTHMFPDDLILDAVSVVDSGYFLLDYYSDNIDRVVSRHLSFLRLEFLDYNEIKSFAAVFAGVVDLRNSFTFNHSNGIAEKTDIVVNALGYSREVREQACISALLHDIGKVFVSNEILDKSGPLELNERYEINKHSYYTRWILNMIEGFENITEWASNHHEKLDGSGYPYGLKENELDEIARILAIIDIYQALTEERPYRKPLDDTKSWSIITEMVNEGKLDGFLSNKIKGILSQV